MAHYTIEDLKHGKSIPDKLDIAIIGAGMSGLYFGWSIMNENPDTDFLIFDKSNRTGGRLDSDVVEFPDGTKVKEEEGGMRFTFDNMDNLMALFLDLDIAKEIVPFPMDSDGNNRLLFRGKPFNNGDAHESNNAVWSSIYNLEFSEQGKSPGEIVNIVFNEVLKANEETFKERPTDRSPEFWQKFRNICKWKDISIINWTLWNLFSDMGYSNECIIMLYRALGFNGVFLSQVNAGIAFQLLEEFPVDPGFKTLERGFSTLPNALVEQIGKEKIFLNTHLDSINNSPEEGYNFALNFTTVDEKGTPFTATLHAKKIILGLPRLALEKLFVTSNALNTLEEQRSEKLWDMLQTSVNYPLLKINLYYEKAWWNEENTGHPSVAFGPNTSDLPLGFVYPFYAINSEVIAALEYQECFNTSGKPIPKDIQKKLDRISNEKYTSPAALTIYCDYLNINFWRGLQQKGERFESEMQHKYNKQVPQTIYPASKSVVAEATKNFKLLFDTPNVPQPVLTSARIWAGNTLFNAPPSEQFGYGVHFWRIHAKDDEIQKELVEPIDNLFTCGEAFSDYQGWVEGSLRSTDRVLKKGFNIASAKEKFKATHGISSSDKIKEVYLENITKMIREYIDPKFEPSSCERDLRLMAARENQIKFGRVRFTYL